MISSKKNRLVELRLFIYYLRYAFVPQLTFKIFQNGTSSTSSSPMQWFLPCDPWNVSWFCEWFGFFAHTSSPGEGIPLRWRLKHRCHERCLCVHDNHRNWEIPIRTEHKQMMPFFDLIQSKFDYFLSMDNCKN